jgi:PD-(D/E)XK nuclease superfamily protein
MRTRLLAWHASRHTPLALGAPSTRTHRGEARCGSTSWPTPTRVHQALRAPLPGRAASVSNGAQLKHAVSVMGTDLGLEVRTEVRVARRIWGAERSIDVVLTRKETGRSLGIECKYQGVTGSAEEKIPATIQDIGAWPIPGLVVFAGDGFSANIRAYLHSTGKAVSLTELDPWLRLFFGLPDA